MLLLLSSLFSLYGCGTNQQDFTLEYGKPTPEECTLPEPTSYDYNDPSYYFGAKLFLMTEETQTLTNAAHLKALGMNTTVLTFFIPYDDDGTLRYPYTVFGKRFYSLEDQICQMSHLIDEMKREGITVFLVGELHYYAEEVDHTIDTPNSLSELSDPEAIENFMEEAPIAMQAMRELADTYKIEVLSPLSEADRYINPAQGDRFMQETLPIFADYEGKLLWQVYGEGFRELDVDPHRFDFRGYDLVGLALLGCDQPIDAWNSYIEDINAWATEDAVPQTMISEIGCVSIPENLPQAADNLRFWYEDSKTYSAGTLVLESPQRNVDSQPISNSWVEDWVREMAVDLGFL
ncbi:MAG: hypothetical protein VX278_17145 [Myxococcota bacterium]|nr:hypothetical protein [Myxococcota bacterium]